MTPTSLYEMLKKECPEEINIGELVESFKRLDSSKIEMKLKGGKDGVFGIEPNTKTRFIIIKWRA